MKRLMTYFIAFSVIFSITSSNYIYAFASEYVSDFEKEFEEDLDEIEAIHNHFKLNITRKLKVVGCIYSIYSNADFTFYHEDLNYTELVPVYVMNQSFLLYN